LSCNVAYPPPDGERQQRLLDALEQGSIFILLFSTLVCLFLRIASNKKKRYTCIDPGLLYHLVKFKDINYKIPIGATNISIVASQLMLSCFLTNISVLMCRRGYISSRYHKFQDSSSLTG
jgi:hypothetical protein